MASSSPQLGGYISKEKTPKLLPRDLVIFVMGNPLRREEGYLVSCSIESIRLGLPNHLPLPTQLSPKRNPSMENNNLRPYHVDRQNGRNLYEVHS